MFMEQELEDSSHQARTAAAASAPRLDLSVVAPTYNEEECLGPFVREVEARLRAMGIRHEIICVDDGSTDGGGTILRALRREVPSLRIVTLVRNLGQSAALAAGIKLARGRFIALMDADLQNDPADLPQMYHRLSSEDRLDGIVGVRAKRCDGVVRRISSRVANWAARLVTGDDVQDAGCGLKLFRASTIKQVTFFRGAHRFLQTLVRLQGKTVQAMEVNHRHRWAGRSKYGSGLGRTFGALRDAFGVRWMRDRRLPSVVVDEDFP